MKKKYLIVIPTYNEKKNVKTILKNIRKFELKIVICVKQVPDTATKIKISENNKTIEQTSIKYEINPYDEYAIEEALRLKENDPNTTITVISLGPERVKQSLTKALAIGADNAIHLKTNEDIKNPLVIAKILASEIKKRSYDLILFGKKSVDQPLVR